MFVKAFLKLFLSKSTFIFCSFKKCCYFFAKTLDKDLPFCYNVKVLNGRLAQLGEHLPYKQRVTGSSPVLSTKESPRAESTTSAEQGSNLANARSVFDELARLRDNSEPMYFPPFLKIWHTAW